MTTMDASLMAQLKKGAISGHEAYMKAADKNQFESYKNS
jgi:hypothetical protein